MIKSRLIEKYKNEVIPELKKRYENPNQIPRLEKVSVNMRVGDALVNSKLMDLAVADLTLITGQKPVIRKAKKSIAQFKVREGNPVGANVTLRRNNAYHFLDKLFNVVLPQLKDFRGLNPNSFDGRGNYSLGLTEQLVFPEIKFENVGKVRGLDICIVTSAKKDEDAKELLVALGLPLRQKGSY